MGVKCQKLIPFWGHNLFWYSTSPVCRGGLSLIVAFVNNRKWHRLTFRSISGGRDQSFYCILFLNSLPSLKEVEEPCSYKLMRISTGVLTKWWNFHCYWCFPVDHQVTFQQQSNIFFIHLYIEGFTTKICLMKCFFNSIFVFKTTN